MSKARTRSSGKTRAKPRTKKGRTSKARKPPPPRVSHARKVEILGLILMTLAILFGLAILSYDPADNGLARSFSLSNAFSPAAARAHNALGAIGALLAWALVPNLLGYPSFLLTVILFLWGYVTFRHRPPGRLNWLTLAFLAGTLLLSCLIGWIGHAFSADLDVWSGAVGLGIAGGLQLAFGAAGSLILIALLAGVLLLLVVDHDIQRSIERFERALDRFRIWLADVRGRASVRREERKQVLAEQQAAYVERQEERQRDMDRKRAERTRGESTPKAASPPAKTGRPVPAAKTRQPASSRSQSSSRQAEPPISGQVTTLNDLFRGREAKPSPSPASPPRVEAPPPPPVSPPPSTVSQTRPVVDESPSEEDGPEVGFSVRERVEEQKANLDDRAPQMEVRNLPYAFPSVEMLEDDDDESGRIDLEELEEKKQLLIDKLDMHNVQISNIEAIVGPTVTLYELTPAPGVKISQIKSLENDLAMAMAARGIRMIVPIPGKTAVGVEIPNRHRELVRIRSVLNTTRFRDHDMELPLILGKTIENELFLQDLTKMPHLLIAGATGSGKSVAVNCYIATLLYACHPANLKFVMIDPKKIELPQYAKVVDHFLAMPADVENPITTDFDHALGALKSCLKEMEKRYDLLSRAGVRSIKEYNRRLQEGRISAEDGHVHLPYIVVIIDELADLMMTAGKEIEAPIARLAQMARAVGIHLVIATQRPSVNVITGLIKANFPSRIAFQVASGVDSRTIIDLYGAEQLVGNGDMLFMRGSQIRRLQSPFISLDEVEALTDFIGEQSGQGPYLLPPMEDERGENGTKSDAASSDRDALFDDAARIIVNAQQGSVSLLQRKLSVGYTRAARIVDQLEEAGIVGPFEGSKARQVLYSSAPELDTYLRSLS